ncbi:hypothetical protein C7Y69_09435 [Alteromonas sp. KS69]|uniref:hypothetical protein n=1 Tax=Alteromonas sp. KS69 TaxID=2109917 RepID=UPI000F86F8BC|nr:hypothetical protein [Alteromonas sp. KS69]RUP81357.1 hypothetical protein C7Y69_09435 [Alteromonas sp. KS69]|tara:strand:- start:10145 stop:10402 length:258 start_codon:yes stop_codon:yes gene_type:complete
MSKNNEKEDVSTDEGTVDIHIDNCLITQAKAALERYPKTVTEQIEQWAYLGSAAEKKLTGLEQLQLLSGEFKISLVDKENEKGKS